MPCMMSSRSERAHSESDSAVYNSSTANGGPGLKKIHSVPTHHSQGAARRQWRAAALKIKDLQDPWAGVMDQIPEEVATRHMYNPHTGHWKTDDVIVRLQPHSFAHGAMRECFRMKKLSKFSQNPDWSNASNYVAKRYMKAVSRNVYFEDVKLQMDAKLWGQEYSNFNPPKKVDFFQTYVIELKDREDSPLYCVEHLIDGKYIKYNSNSGFVSEVNRLTPQAFSHFTFERSNHRLIVVDIQGVGDLYTDPQIHTVGQEDYGEANLGTRGVALFFSSHICSPLCQALGLTQFDLSDKELQRLSDSKRWNFSSAATAIHLSKSEPVMLGRGREAVWRKREAARHAFRTLSLGLSHQPTSQGKWGRYLESPLSGSEENFPSDSHLDLDSPGITMTAPPSSLLQQLDSLIEGDVGEGRGCEEEQPNGKEDCDDAFLSCASDSEPKGEARCSGLDGRHQSGCSCTAVRESQSARLSSDGCLSSASAEKELTRVREGGSKMPESSGLLALGQVHLELARYHEMGRFSQEETPDFESSIFHLRKAASCGLPAALSTLAQIYLQHPHDEFRALSVEASPVNESLGMELLVRGAEAGVTAAMVAVARAYDSGMGLGEVGGGGQHDGFSVTQRSQDWTQAVKWYTQALASTSDDEHSAEGRGEPAYTLLARLAEMYRHGGHGLDWDCQKAGELYSQAAEEALAGMKGKVANKFYMLAEEVWSEAET